MSRRVQLRLCAVGAVAILAFEFVAFSDFDGAQADDRVLIKLGAETSDEMPPPNILFLIDNSGSMNNFMCEDMTGSECNVDALDSREAPNEATVCYNPRLAEVTGKDTDGDGVPNAYVAPFAWDGTTFVAPRYDIYDERADGETDDVFVSASILAHSWNQPWEVLAVTATEDDIETKITNVIQGLCAGIGQCWQRSRCIYSLRTQGYFWEPSDLACGAGDPMELGCDPDARLGAGLGEACDTELDCASPYVCNSNVCSKCTSNDECTGGGGDHCVNSEGNEDCSHYYCDDTQECEAEGTGSSASYDGPPVSQCECADPDQCTDHECAVPSSATCDTEDRPETPDPKVCETVDIPDGVTVPDSTVILCGAQIFNGVTIGENVWIGANASIKSGTTIESDVYIGNNVETKSKSTIKSGTYIGDNSVVKAQDILESNVCIGDNVEIKAKVDIGSGSQIGSDVVIHANADIGENVVIADGSRLKAGTEVPDGTTVLGSVGNATEIGIFLGDFLNFYPPKGAALIKVVSDVLAQLPGDARVGSSDLDDSGGTVAFTLDPLCDDVGTSCFDQSPSTSCFDIADARTYFRSTLNFSGGTPIAKALDNVGQYYAVSGDDATLCDYTGITTCPPASYVVAISDGFPSNDAEVADDVPFSDTEIDGITDGYAATNDSFLDDVAKVLATKDFYTGLDDNQTVKTYVVSYGFVDSENPDRCHGLLESTAAAGDATCLTATSGTQLKNVLTAVLLDILQSALGFTSASMPTTHSTATTTSYQAVFRPTEDFELWEGHLYSFPVCDEWLGRVTGEICTCASGSGPNDLCVQGADEELISYDEAGYLLTGKPLWDAQLCLSGDLADSLGADIAQDRFNLDVSQCFMSAEARVIHTAVEQAEPTDELTSADMILFTVDNVTAEEGSDQLLNALAVGGNVETGQDVVRFYRGWDTTNADGDEVTLEDRNLNNIRDADGVVDGWWKLGDMFHSIPAVVERPNGRNLGPWAGSDSYEAFKAGNDDRDRVILVGANDGMLHAFLAAIWDEDEDEYDEGHDGTTTHGKELWAFISPEVLPKLNNYCDPDAEACGLSNHGFLIDGSVMVRDIWTGGAADKEAAGNSENWKTVAIYGHRRGGTTFIALDVTDVDDPVFLWQFPQASHVDGEGALISSRMGQAWLDSHPAPASIGPLRIDTDNDPDTDGYYDKWVVLLSGGYDARDSKGRMLFIVDAYTGDLLGMFEKTDTGDTQYMNYSFPATPVFYSSLGTARPYIHGIVAVDHGGQLWHIETPPATVTDGVIDNFTPKVIFRTVATPISPDPLSGNDGTIALSEYQRRPLFFAPALTRNGHQVRAIFASGDRDLLIPHSSLTLDEHTITEDVSNAACGVSGSDDYVQRLYAVDLAQCSGTDGLRPCTENDLREVKPSLNQYAERGHKGWYMKLRNTEKSAAPYDIFAGYALYSTFLPSWPCTGGSNTCSTEPAGNAYLYARHYLTGKSVDWDNDGSVLDEDEGGNAGRVELGAGVPAAPVVAVGVADGSAMPGLLSGSSDGGGVSKRFSALQSEQVVEILHFPVDRSWHEVLHQ